MIATRFPAGLFQRLSTTLLASFLTIATASAQTPQAGAGAELPSYLRDRGAGTPTSMFGTYVEKGELLVYPFFEYYLDDNAEYAPNEFGYVLDEDYRGRYRASEGLIFLGYGVTEDLALEVEAAAISASLETSADDPTAIADKIEESGLGDVQTQLDWRWLRETPSRPELFSYLEVVYPFSKDKYLIGTSDWEFKYGAGMVRGYGWGTVTFRAAVEYSRAEKKFDLGEVALEYLKRVSPSWRLYAGVEGTQDEIELITEAQWHVSRHAFIKINNAFGLTSKATDWAPEIGIVLSFPVK